MTAIKHQYDGWTPWSHSEIYNEENTDGDTRLNVVTFVSNHGNHRYFDGLTASKSYKIDLNIEMGTASEVKVYLWDVNGVGAVSNERVILTASSTGNHTGTFTPLYNKVLVQVRRSSGSNTVYFYMDDFKIYETLIREKVNTVCSSDSNSYWRGFNGMLKDNEMFGGDCNSYDFGARMYNPRLGRWMSCDPLESKYPDLSPYQFVADNPLVSIDPNGEEIIIIIHYATRGSKNGGKSPGHTSILVTTYEEVSVEVDGQIVKMYKLTGATIYHNVSGSSTKKARDTKLKKFDRNSLRLAIKQGGYSLTATVTIKEAKNGIIGKDLQKDGKNQFLDPSATYYNYEDVKEELAVDNYAKNETTPASFEEFNCADFVNNCLDKGGFIEEGNTTFGTTKIFNKVNYANPNALYYDAKKIADAKGLAVNIYNSTDAQNFDKDKTKEAIEEQTPKSQRP